MLSVAKIMFMNLGESTNSIWQHAIVTRQQRDVLHCHRRDVLLSTGLSASGKTSLPHTLVKTHYHMKCRIFVVGDGNVRHSINKNLGFTLDDRGENLSCIREAGKLVLGADTKVLVAFIFSSLSRQRKMSCSLLPLGNYFEINCNAQLEIGEQRETKELYLKVRGVEPNNWSAHLNEPLIRPALIDNTGVSALEEGVQQVHELLQSRKMFQ